ncbi:MAG: glycosyltransferase involved in cell wall biosynthesis [Limisphaerales bacterium]
MPLSKPETIETPNIEIVADNTANGRIVKDLKALEKPRVIHILNRTNLGGPTLIAGYLVDQLKDRYETSLLTGMKDDSEASSEYMIDQFGIKPVYIQNMQRSISLGKDRKAYLEIASIIRTFKPHVVHTHASKAGLIGRAAAWQNKVPVLVHTFHGHIFHSYFGKVKTQVFLELERFLAKKSHAIIAISETQKRELCGEFKVCPESKMRVIPLGLDLDRFKDEDGLKRKNFRAYWKIQDDEIVLMHVGRVVPVKNHLLFLDALKKVRDKGFTKVRGFIVGDGEDRQRVEDYAKEIGLDFAIGPNSGSPLTFTSWIREVDEVMAGGDAVVLTSKNEGTPLSLIEAQAAAKPIVSTRVGGVCDILQEGQTGDLVPAGDADAFALALENMVENPGRMKEMGSRGREFVLDRFSLTGMADKTSALYQELLG